MLYPGDFVYAIETGKYSPMDTPVLARIALNALLDPERFPVDISDIRALGCDARLAARAFLAFMATNPDRYATWDALRCKELIKIEMVRSRIVASEDAIA